MTLQVSHEMYPFREYRGVVRHYQQHPHGMDMAERTGRGVRYTSHQTESTEQVEVQPMKTTTRGRPIRQPARYWTSTVPQGPAQKGGGSCKAVAAGARRSTEESGDRQGGRVSRGRESEGARRKRGLICI